MVTIMNIVYALVMLLAFIIVSGYFWQWFYAAPTSQNETHYCDTTDGWKLALHHYRAAQPAGKPVVLCHGLSSNRYAFELPTAPSLAKYLMVNGKDVWVAELRGSGMSETPGLYKSDVPYTWSFDDHLEKDVPVIIEKVRELTGAKAIHWVGHSMGGMLMLAHLASHPDAPLASGTAIGSPTDFSKMNLSFANSILKMRHLFEFLPISPLPFLARLATPFASMLPQQSAIGFDLKNIESGTARRVLALACQLVTSNKIWFQFGSFITNASFADPEGRLYMRNFTQTKVPVYLMAGSCDLMAPPEAVTWLCESKDNQVNAKCEILGKLSRCSEDYGHLDLLVGSRARDEVFPKILSWIEQNESEAADN